MTQQPAISPLHALLRRLVGLLLAVGAAVELSAVAWVLLVGPVAVHLGSLHLVTQGTGRPLVFGVLAGTLSVTFLEPFLGPVARARLERLCVVAAYAIAIISLAPLMKPVLLPGLPVGHDSSAHQTYAFLMNRAIEQGQLPVRWVEGTVAGLAQPLFNHYQVGFYYLVILLARACGSLAIALKLAVVGMWAAGGWLLLLFCRKWGRLPALLAAVVFVWSPYLLVDVYVRAAYPELAAIACAAGVIWASDGVLRTGRRFYVCALASMTALVLLGHLPTAVIVSPLALAYVAGASAIHADRRRRVWQVVGGAVLGAGLAAFYMVPAIAELRFVRAGKLTTDYFDYHHHFARPASWLDPAWGYGGSGEGTASQLSLSLQIGTVQWLVLIAAIAWLGVQLARRRPLWELAQVAGWLAVAIGAMFMMTSASVLVWETVTPLAFLQFPWRFLMVPALACSVLAALLLATLRSRSIQALAVVCAVTLQWYATRDPRKLAVIRERAPATIDNPAWPSTDADRRWVFREAGYDPVTVTQEPRQPAPRRWTLVEGQAAVVAHAETDVRTVYLVRAETDVRMVINAPFYPGWTLSIDGLPRAISVVPGSGYMAIDVPRGRHRVEAAFGRTAVRVAAEIVTLASGLILVGVAGWPLWRRLARSLPRGA